MLSGVKLPGIGRADGFLPGCRPLRHNGINRRLHARHGAVIFIGEARVGCAFHTDAGLHERAVQPIEIEAVLRYQQVGSLGQLKADVIGVSEDAGDHILCGHKRVNPGDSGAGYFDFVADPEAQRFLQLLFDGTFSGLLGQASFQKLRYGDLLRQGLDSDRRFGIRIEKFCPGCPDGLCLLYTRKGTDGCKVIIIHQERG